MNKYEKYNDLVLDFYFYNLEGNLRKNRELSFLVPSFLADLKANKSFTEDILNKLRLPMQGVLAYLDYLENMDDKELNSVRYYKYVNDIELKSIRERLAKASIEVKKALSREGDGRVGVFSILRDDILKTYSYQSNRLERTLISDKLINVMLENDNAQELFEKISQVNEEEYNKNKIYSEYLINLMKKEEIVNKDRSNTLEIETICKETQKRIAEKSRVPFKDSGTSNIFEYIEQNENLKKEWSNFLLMTKFSVKTMVENLPKIVETYKLSFGTYLKLLNIIEENPAEKLFLLEKIGQILAINRSDIVIFYLMLFKEKVHDINKNNEGFFNSVLENRLISENPLEKMKVFSLSVILYLGGEKVDLSQFLNYFDENLKKYKDISRELKERVFSLPEFSFLFNHNSYLQNKEISSEEYKVIESSGDLVRCKNHLMRLVSKLSANSYKKDIESGIRKTGAYVSEESKNILEIDKKDLSLLLSKSINIQNSKNEELILVDAIKSKWHIIFSDDIDLTLLSENNKEKLMIAVVEFYNELIDGEKAKAISPLKKYREILLTQKLDENEKDKTLITSRKKI